MINLKKILPTTLAGFAVLLIAVVFSTLGFSARADKDANMDFCSQTAKAALKACRADATDDFWIAVGNCKNLSDADERDACKSEAELAREEAHEECGEQSRARLDVCEVIGEAPYDPQIDPAQFVDPTQIGQSVLPNPYFPLIPGTVWIYEGGDETITVTVTDDTKEIQGVTVVVVRDVVEEDGELIEDTNDWYAQDISGNVWYFGEIALNFEDGELVDIEGSWKSGTDSAKAGILFEAVPQVSDMYRQEFALGEAEDMGEVISTTGTESSAFASCLNNCVVTRDFSPLEPGVEENKYYAPGIGLILEVDPESDERVELVEMSMP